MRPNEIRDQWIQRARLESLASIDYLLCLWSGGRILCSSQAQVEMVSGELPLPIAVELLDAETLLGPADLVLSDSSREDVAHRTDRYYSPATKISFAHLRSAIFFLSEFLKTIKVPLEDLNFTREELGPYAVDQNSVSRDLRPALFLDRDGTIIHLVPYLKDPRHVELNFGIVELLRWARQAGYLIIGVTNQSGIGRGYYTWREYDQIQERMSQLLSDQGVAVDGMCAAGYYSESSLAIGHLGAGLRKPNPGMLIWAARRWGVDLASSVMVGDSQVDLGAGQNAGCERSFLLTADFNLSNVLNDLRGRP